MFYKNVLLPADHVTYSGQLSHLLISYWHVHFQITVHVSVMAIKMLKKFFARMRNYWKIPRTSTNEEALKVQEHEQGE